MIDHGKPFEYVLDRVNFAHNGAQFSGRGILSWDPEKGIHIQAFLDKSAPHVNQFASIGFVEIQNSSDAHTVRLAVRGLGHALVPNVFPRSLGRYLDEGRLSIRPQRVVFFRHYPTQVYGKREDNQFWSGSADFLTESEPEFPDELKTETTLNGQTIQTRNKGGFAMMKRMAFQYGGTEQKMVFLEPVGHSQRPTQRRPRRGVGLKLLDEHSRSCLLKLSGYAAFPLPAAIQRLLSFGVRKRPIT